MSNGRRYEIPCVYQIRVKGTFPHDWSSWFEGFSVSLQENDETLLNGRVEDQAALHGVLAKIASLGLPLLSVTRLESADEHPEVTTEAEGERRNEHNH